MFSGSNSIISFLPPSKGGGVKSEKKQFAQIRANYADMDLGIVPLDREYHVK